MDVMVDKSRKTRTFFATSAMFSLFFLLSFAIINTNDDEYLCFITFIIILKSDNTIITF